MSFGTGAGKGSLPRAVKGEAFRAAYDSIKKPAPLQELLAQFDVAINARDSKRSNELHKQIIDHPYYKGKPLA
jgi:DNA-binding NtrC family response regulator